MELGTYSWGPYDWSFAGTVTWGLLRLHYGARDHGHPLPPISVFGLVFRASLRDYKVPARPVFAPSSSFAQLVHLPRLFFLYQILSESIDSPSNLPRFLFPIAHPSSKPLLCRFVRTSQRTRRSQRRRRRHRKTDHRSLRSPPLQRARPATPTCRGPRRRKSRRSARPTGTSLSVN